MSSPVPGVDYEDMKDLETSTTSDEVHNYESRLTVSQNLQKLDGMLEKLTELL